MKIKTDTPNIIIKPLNWLVPYTKNAKNHPEEQIQRLAATIRRFGWDQPIVTESDGTIIKGHGRRLAALHLGLTEVPVWIRHDLTKNEADAARIADNAVVGLQFDTRVMHDELQRLMSAIDVNFTIDELGLSKKDIDLLTATLDTVTEEVIMQDTHDEIERQKDEDAERVATSDAQEITLSQAFGFSKLTRAEGRAVSKAMAMAETVTGLEKGEALAKWLETII